MLITLNCCSLKMYAYLDFYAYFMCILLNISPLLQHSINTLGSWFSSVSEQANMPGGRRAVGLSSSATHDSLLLHVFPSLCPHFPDWTSLFFKEILKYFFHSLFETTLLFQFSFLCFNFSEFARRASSGSHKINVQNRENKSKPIINYRYYLIKNKLPWLL